MTDRKVNWPDPIAGGWPYRSNFAAPAQHMAESSCGPLVIETAEEALMRRVRYAAAHPLKEKAPK